jgi:class 3 adenylate cyclase
LSVPALPSKFGLPRTVEAETEAPGTGTFVHTDLSGVRHVITTLGDEASADLIASYQAIVSGIVEANNGIVLESSGDHVFAVFRNASDAVRTSSDVREALRDFAWPPECDVAVSIVVHSGRWSGDPRRPLAATAFTWLVRFGKVVEPGQVIVSQATAALLEGDRSAPELRSLGEHTVGELDEPVQIYELVESRVTSP